MGDEKKRKAPMPAFAQRDFLLSARGAPCKFTLFYESEKLSIIGLDSYRFTVEEWDEIQAAFLANRDRP